MSTGVPPFFAVQPPGGAAASVGPIQRKGKVMKTLAILLVLLATGSAFAKILVDGSTPAPTKPTPKKK